MLDNASFRELTNFNNSQPVRRLRQYEGAYSLLPNGTVLLLLNARAPFVMSQQIWLGTTLCIQDLQFSGDLES